MNNWLAAVPFHVGDGTSSDRAESFRNTKFKQGNPSIIHMHAIRWFTCQRDLEMMQSLTIKMYCLNTLATVMRAPNVTRQSHCPLRHMLANGWQRKCQPVVFVRVMDSKVPLHENSTRLRDASFGSPLLFNRIPGPHPPDLEASNVSSSLCWPHQKFFW